MLDTCFDVEFPVEAFDASMSDPSLFTNQDQWLIRTEHDALERPGTPVDEEVIRSYENMAGVCV